MRSLTMPTLLRLKGHAPRVQALRGKCEILVEQRTAINPEICPGTFVPGLK